MAMALVAVAICGGGDGCSGKSDCGGNCGRQTNGRGLDGVGGDDDDESARANGDAAFGEEVAQAFDCAIDALLRRLIADTKGLRHRPRGLALEITQEECVAIRLAQLAQCCIKVRGDVFPEGVGFGGKQFIHGGGFLFANATAHLGADGVGRKILRRSMQPAGEHVTVRKLRGVLCQSYEHTLRHILGQVRIANQA
jgi:hypothetical protein